jgi:hypothetical protein
MARSPVLRSSFIFQRFLKDDDAQSFNNFKKTASKLQAPQSLSGFASEDGVLRLDSQREDSYVRNLGYFIEHSDALTGELKQHSKALMQALKGVSQVLTKMSETCSKLEGLQSILPNLQSNAVMYSALGTALNNWAQSEFGQTSLVNEYFAQFLAYSSAEIKPLKDLLGRRNECLANYLKADARLTPKKDKLWYAGDSAKWELGPEDRSISPAALYADKALSYSKMLPNETAAVNALQDRFAYFNARLKVESERVLWANSLLDNSHFTDFTKKEADCATHLHIHWSQTRAQLAAASHEALATQPLVVV